MIKKSIVIFLLFFVFSSCKKEEKKDETLKQVQGNKVKDDYIAVTKVDSYTYEELKPLLYKNDDKIYVVNFWATWCAPCVKELPYFEKLKAAYQDKNVEVLLVSLDFPKQVEKRLIPFINKKKLKSKVVLLNDVNEDVWIKAIDSTWGGALPATLIYNTKKRSFFEQSFDYKTLENKLQTFTIQ